MRSRSCGTGSRRGREARATGFTLIEVILVVALIGGIAVLVLSGVVGRSEGSERRRAVGGLIAELATARVEAMRSGEAVSAEARCVKGRLLFTAGGRRAEWRAPGLLLADESGKVLELARVRFQPSGRVDVRGWGVMVKDEASATSAAGRMWRIEFDPISGAAMLRREGEASRSGQVEEVIR